jgi:hypothetical protein
MYMWDRLRKEKNEAAVKCDKEFKGGTLNMHLCYGQPADPLPSSTATPTSTDPQKETSFIPPSSLPSPSSEANPATTPINFMPVPAPLEPFEITICTVNGHWDRLSQCRPICGYDLKKKSADGGCEWKGQAKWQCVVCEKKILD